MAGGATARLNSMEAGARHLMQAIALGVEVVAALLIALGAAEAVGRLLAARLRGGLLQRREVWLRFATWLVLALEFLLAADVLRTAVSPTWSEVGRLGAIAVIRTFLNYFLARDMRELSRARPASTAGAPAEQTLPPVH
jgi:uncharacterized membrane protein